MSPQERLARLTEVAAAYCDGRISYESMDRRQRATWAAVAAAGQTAAVTALWRAANPAGGVR